MKICLYLLSLLYTIVSFSQASEIAAEIEYKIFNNTAKPNTMFCTMFVNGTSTIYLTKYSSKTYIDPDKSASIIREESFIDEKYIKIDHANKNILAFEPIGRTMMLVEDTYNKLDWKVTQEAKQISGYNCVKATTSYRGRDWVVWFTPDIPLPYGPWKLHSLPGLIIEATETTDTYTWRIEKIEYKKSVIFSKDFKDLVVTKNTAPISKKQYVEDEAEYMDNVFARMGGTSTKTIRAGYELQYEWE